MTEEISELHGGSFSGQKLLPNCEPSKMATRLVNLPSGRISIDTLPEIVLEKYLGTNIIKGPVEHTQASHNKNAKDSPYRVKLLKAIEDRHDEPADESVRCVNMYNIQLHDKIEDAMLYGPLVSGADEEPPWKEPPTEAHEPADAQVVPVFVPILHLLNALPKPTKEMIFPKLVE